MGSSSLRVVLDTNVIVSAAIKSGSIPAYLVAAGINQKYELCYSDEIMEEYSNVLMRGKFQLPSALVRALMNDIQSNGRRFMPHTTITACSHREDNKFLECAQAAGALYLVTGNKKHFPDQFGVTKIVSPREFAMILVSAGIIE